MEEELPVTPEQHRDLIQITAVFWWLEWELDFWLGQLSPAPMNRSGLSGPYAPPFIWQRYRLLNPWVLLQGFLTRIFKDDHKVKAAPWGPKVMVQKMRFIGCFQQLHWLWGRKRHMYPSGNVSMERRLQTQRQQW